MKRQLQGIAVILLSILFTLGFDSAGWKYVFDLSMHWSHIFMITGILGAAMVFWKSKKDN